MKLSCIKIAVFFSFAILLVLSPLCHADEGDIFIDPSDPTVIRRTVVPFASEILLRTSDLPASSEAHPNVLFGDQAFSYIKLSPEGTHLAFSVDGSLSDWSGIYEISSKQVRQVGLSFDSVALAPYWSVDGRRVVFEEEDSSHRRYLQVYDLSEGSRCTLDGRLAKGKFLDFTNPWWSETGDKVYFRVDVNNNYRRSTGLKPLTVPSRIGEANLQCQALVLRSVEKFMAEVPAKSIPQEAMVLFSKSPL